MFGTIGKWLMESALMTSPAGPFIIAAGKFFKKIPWQVWAAIGIAIALWLGVRWHEHKVHEIYQSGYNQAVADIKAAEAKKVEPYKTAAAVANAKVDAGTEGVRKNAADQNHRIDDNRADLLSMYATPPHRGGARADAGVHQADGGAGAQPAGPSAVDGLAEAGDSGAAPEPTITVPAKPLIEHLATCDLDYVALKAWEQQYANYMKAYDEWAATVKAAH